MVKDLYMSAINERSEEYDWSGEEKPGGNYSEDWDLPFSTTEDEEENEDFVPVMNYRYKVPGLERHLPSDKEIKKNLNEAGSVTLVRDTRDDEYYFALSGGGMDLSWDIARAYVKFGYAPPAQFCDLPDMTISYYDQEVVDACRQTVNGIKDVAGRVERTLNALEDKYGGKREKKLFAGETSF